jgi:hypothetical protein
MLNHNTGAMSVEGLYSGRAIAEAVGRRPLAEEARVITRVICGGQSSTGTDFSQTFLASTCEYHSTGVPYSYIVWGGEQQDLWWPQFRDMVSPHRHEQQSEQRGITFSLMC